jgi:hypothetical protein
LFFFSSFGGSFDFFLGSLEISFFGGFGGILNGVQSFTIKSFFIDFI